MKKLSDEQVEAFDTDYVDEARWRAVESLVRRDFPEGKFRFLDVGGGTGRFADLILSAFPLSEGTVLDNSETLVARNKVASRKKVILKSVEHLNTLERGFDLICFNWLLHHLVGDSYSQTTINQIAALREARALLKGSGRILVYENVYDGLMLDRLPSWMIFHLCASKMMKPVTGRLGANTAGVGVCFLSRRQWFKAIKQSGLEVINYCEPDNWEWSMSLSMRMTLGVRRRYVGLFWMRAIEAVGSTDQRNTS